MLKPLLSPIRAAETGGVTNEHDIVFGDLAALSQGQLHLDSFHITMCNFAAVLNTSMAEVTQHLLSQFPVHFRIAPASLEVSEGPSYRMMCYEYASSLAILEVGQLRSLAKSRCFHFLLPRRVFSSCQRQFGKLDCPSAHRSLNEMVRNRTKMNELYNFWDLLMIHLILLSMAP